MKVKSKLYIEQEEESISNSSSAVSLLKSIEKESSNQENESSKSKSPSPTEHTHSYVTTTNNTNSDHLHESNTVIVEESVISKKLKESTPPSLVVILGPEHMMGRHWVLNKPEITIGRSRRNDICIQEPSISKTHLFVNISDDEEISIIDKVSTNGVIINDKSLEKEKEAALNDNDQIKIGNVVLKFLDRGNLEILSIAKSFKRAFQDELTKLGNRALLECRAPEIFRLSKQHNYPLSVIIFDIDHFKNINDTYGHLAGDFILKEVAQLTQSCFRSKDLLARSGGEEFCVILNSTLKRSLEAAENVRKKIDEYKFQLESHKINLSISGGISIYNDKDEKWFDIYQRADKGLYQSKSGGRNKISVFN